MSFGKSVGELFKPKNMFSRLARGGGAVAGGFMGGPMGAKMGYDIGDKVAGTWEDKDQEESGFGNLFNKGKMPSFGGETQGTGFNFSNLFNRGTDSNGIDLETILKLVQMAG